VCVVMEGLNCTHTHTHTSPLPPPRHTHMHTHAHRHTDKHTDTQTHTRAHTHKQRELKVGSDVCGDGGATSAYRLQRTPPPVVGAGKRLENARGTTTTPAHPPQDSCSKRSELRVRSGGWCCWFICCVCC